MSLLYRVDVQVEDGRRWSAELHSGSMVKLYYCGAGKARHELCEVRLVDGQIPEMRGAALLPERVYRSIEAAIEHWVDIPR